MEAFQNRVGDEPPAHPTTLYRGVITHDGYATIECDKDHRVIYAFQGGAHALLYERALQRLADDAPRDAILDAYTAFEVFMQMVVERCVFEAQTSVTLDDVRAQLGYVFKSSERTLGAALVAVATRTGSAPPKIPGDIQNLRNDATHRARYPSVPQAEKAILAIGGLIRDFDALLDAVPTARTEQYKILAAVEPQISARRGDPTVTISSIGMSLVLAPLGTRVEPAQRLEEYRDGRGLLQLE